MIGSLYAEIVEKLEDFRVDLRRSNVEYYLKCKRKRHSCIVSVVLRNPNTNKIVLDLQIKVRCWLELSSHLEQLLTYCRHFAVGLQRSGSPEY